MSLEAVNTLPAPTSEETASNAAPASGSPTQQDTNLTGSGEATDSHREKVAVRERPEEIESPEEWLKNAQAINEQIIAQAPVDGVLPPTPEPEATTAAVEPAPPVEAAKPAEAAKPDDDPDDQKKVRVRLNRDNFKSDDDYRIAVKATKLQNEFGLLPSQAEVEARRLLNLPASNAAPAAQTQPQAQPEVPDARTDGKPATLEATDAEIARLRAEKRKSFTVDADLEKTADLDEQIDALRDHKATLASEANSRALSQQSAFARDSQASMQRAVEQFPTSKEKDSALTKEMLALDAEWKEDGNPLYHSANKPFLLAQRADARLKRNGPAPAAPVVASPQPVTPARPVQPAPIATGGQRTTQASATQQGQQLERVNKISNAAEYEAYLKELKAA